MNRNESIEVLKNVAKNLCEKWDYKFCQESASEHPIDIWMEKTYDKSNYEITIFQFEGGYKANNGKNGYIQLRSRFGDPRIDVYSPYKKAFAAVELSDSILKEDGSFTHTNKYEFSEAQIFYQDGIQLFQDLISMIKYEENIQKWVEEA